MANIELHEALKQEGINLDTGDQLQKGNNQTPVEGDSRSIVVNGVTIQQRYEVREEGTAWYNQGEYADSITTDQLKLSGVVRGVFDNRQDGSVVSFTRPSFATEKKSLIVGDTNSPTILTGSNLVYVEGSETLLTRTPQPLKDANVTAEKIEFKVTRSDYFKLTKLVFDVDVTTKIRIVIYDNALRRPTDQVYENVSQFKFNNDMGDVLDHTTGTVELSRPTYGATGAELWISMCTSVPVTYQGTIIETEFVPYYEEFYYPAGDPVEMTDESNVKEHYEANANTNAFEDAEKSKLLNITAGAEPNNISDINATDLTGGGETTLHTHPSNSTLVKTAFSEITVDTTTTTQTWGTTLLSIPITPANANNYFLINFTAAADASTESDIEIQFRLSVGLTGSETVRRATYIFSDNIAEAGSCALVYKAQAVGVGEHTVKIEWKIGSSGTIRIRPVTQPNSDHASLLVQEVTV